MFGPISIHVCYCYTLINAYLTLIEKGYQTTDLDTVTVCG